MIIMSALEHPTFRLPALVIARTSLEAFRLWRRRRRSQRIARLVARQFAGLSPHMRDDIGVPAPERGANSCHRLWTGGVT
jgi:hypothetical protein